MSSTFDFDGIRRQVIEAARGKMLRALEEARQEMGTEGEGIEFDESSITESGEQISFGTARFPSEDAKERFLEIFRRKLR